jgi:hypothetical protein
MRKSVFEFCTVLLISLIITVSLGFYFLNIQPKQLEIDALDKGPGGIVELTNQRYADKAYTQNIGKYKEELLKTKKELTTVKMRKTIKE